MAKATTLTLNEAEVSDFLNVYLSIKPKHPDAALLFRYKDDYLIVGSDAQRTMRILDINPRIINLPEYDGFKYLSFHHGDLDTMLPKLVRAGSRVAICEQLEDPRSKHVNRTEWKH